MALSDLILPKGKVVVLLSESINDVVTAEGGTALNFGSVQRVYETSDKTTVGDSVLFNINKSTPFTIISGNVFYLIDETDIQFTETVIPPP
ncbi:MAG TPA: hypothetical protein PJ987_12795 [Bacteroidia bacterium]|nr:hypothetical protein [Bacteroidia bacterium]